MSATKMPDVPILLLSSSLRLPSNIVSKIHLRLARTKQKEKNTSFCFLCRKKAAHLSPSSSTKKTNTRKKMIACKVRGATVLCVTLAFLSTRRSVPGDTGTQRRWEGYAFIHIIWVNDTNVCVHSQWKLSKKGRKEGREGQTAKNERTGREKKNQ